MSLDGARGVGEGLGERLQRPVRGRVDAEQLVVDGPVARVRRVALGDPDHRRGGAHRVRVEAGAHRGVDGVAHQRHLGDRGDQHLDAGDVGLALVPQAAVGLAAGDAQLVDARAGGDQPFGQQTERVARALDDGAGAVLGAVGEREAEQGAARARVPVRRPLAGQERQEHQAGAARRRPLSSGKRLLQGRAHRRGPPVDSAAGRRERAAHDVRPRDEVRPADHAGHR